MGLREEERERLARLPKTCEACGSSGLCTKCDGKGQLFAMFLVQNVKEEHKFAGLDFGRVLQGCDNCGGYRQNLVGELRKGTGLCPVCNGTGKIWPEIAKKPFKKKKRESMAMEHMGSTDNLMMDPTDSMTALQSDGMGYRD